MCHEPRRNSPSVTTSEADLLLHPENIADRIILDMVQLFGRKAAGSVLLPRPRQFRRPQQAADLVGAERWCITHAR
jgi:hypothetical protein